MRRRQARESRSQGGHHDGMSSDDELPSKDSAQLTSLKQDVEGQARIAMEDVVEEHGLTEEYHEDVLIVTRNAPFWLGYDDAPGGMDEASDTEGPEPDLRRENEELRRAFADLQAFIAAVQDLRDHQGMRLEIERMCMLLEDRR